MPLRMYCSAIVGRPVHPHMLRLSFASRLRAKEADLQLIQEILGHESIQTTTMWHISTPLRTATAARYLQGGREMMQQIRIVADATRIPRTENMGLALSDQPDQTWIARLRQLAAAAEGGPALHLHVEGATLVFACADRADLVERRRLIGQLVDETNAEHGGRSV